MIFTIANRTTGELLHEYQGSQIDLNTPEGCIAIAGSFDRLSQRYDELAGKVVDYQPPAPSADHEWIHDDERGNRVRRWVLKPVAAKREARKSTARARIAVLEGKLPRALLENALGIEPTPADRAAGAMALQEIQNELAALRPEVR